MNEKKNILHKLVQLDEQKIIQEKLNLGKLWLVQHQDELYGPYYEDQLVQLIPKHSLFLAKTLSCNLRTKEWKPFFKHPAFEKRKRSDSPSIPIRQEEKHSGIYYLLHNGQKAGPFSDEEVNRKLEKHEINIDTLISSDNGRTWRKIYHFKNFDRRIHDPDASLIFQMPNEQEFEKSRIYTTNLLKVKKGQEQGDLQSALQACKNHISRNKDSKKSLFEQFNTKLSSEHTKSAHGFKFQFKHALMIALVVLTTLILLEPASNIPSKQGKNIADEGLQNQQDRVPSSGSDTKLMPRKIPSFSQRKRNQQQRINNDALDAEGDYYNYDIETHSSADSERTQLRSPKKRSKPKRKAKARAIENDAEADATADLEKEIDDILEQEEYDEFYDDERVPASEDELIELEEEEVLPEEEAGIEGEPEAEY